MIGAITIFIIFSIICIMLFWRCSMNKFDYFCAIVCGLGIGFICTIFLVPLSLCIIEYADPEVYSAEEVATYDISAINDNYIGQYYGEDGPCYSFLYSVDNGLREKTINTSDAIIIYTEEDPYIIAANIRFVNPILNFFCGPVNIEYTIYIPEGSVVQDTYRIDLE